jgi:hypothetical protein
MSQRRQDARKAAQDRRRQERRQARIEQRRRAMAARSPRTATAAPSPVTSAPKPGLRQRRVVIGPLRMSVPALIGSVVGVLVLAVVAFYIIAAQLEPLPGTKFESNGNLHVSPGEPHGAYFSNPPTSGWHYAPIPNPGIYTNPQEPEALGHFMEHGGVWVLYTCPDGCPEVVSRLQEIVTSFTDRRRPVALAPYPAPGREAPEQRINVIAWQYKLSMDEVARGAIEEFIERHVCRYNPEGGLWCGAVRGKTGPVKTPASGGFNAISASATATATATATASGTSTPTPRPAGPTAPSPTATGTP